VVSSSCASAGMYFEGMTVLGSSRRPMVSSLTSSLSASSILLKLAASRSSRSRLLKSDASIMNWTVTNASIFCKYFLHAVSAREKFAVRFRS
jgi:hypothetical protein